MLAVVAAEAPAGPLALAGFSFGASVAGLAADALWSARSIEKIVLVGTAVSRLMLPRCLPRPTSARWSSTASRTTPCRSPP